MSLIRIPVKRWSEETSESDTTDLITVLTHLTMNRKKMSGFEAFNLVSEISTACDDIMKDDDGEFIMLGSATFKWVKKSFEEDVPPAMGFHPEQREVVETILSL